MDRLTKKFTDGSAYCEEIDDVELKNVNYPIYVGKAVDKLAEYEDFEEIFREKKTDTVCEFLKDKEEFSKWLDRIEWIAKKCDEYARAEEQGLLLRLPCKVGDILYYTEECFNIVIPVRLNEIVMSFVGLDTYSFQYNCCSFDECGDVYGEYEFDECDINKTVFLTQSEAEQKLKEIKKAIREIEISYDYNHSKNDYDIVLNLTELANLIKTLQGKAIDDFIGMLGEERTQCYNFDDSEHNNPIKCVWWNDIEGIAGQLKEGVGNGTDNQ